MFQGQEVPHCLWSCSFVAVWLLQFGIGFPHDWCPFCYVQSFCSPVFVPIFLRSHSASSTVIQLLFFSLILACIPSNFFSIFVPSVLLSCLSYSKLCTLIRVTVQRFESVINFVIHLYSPVSIFICQSVYFSPYFCFPRHYSY